MVSSSLGGAVVVAALFAFLQMSAVDANHRCKRDCRLPILRGDSHCNKPCRRWAYNSSCGQCVSFSYTGCGGDENNFVSLDECNSCCKHTPPCPKFNLPPPPENCRYKWYTDDDGCPKYRLICECKRDTCHPGVCRHGQFCVPEPKECLRCPCPQYRCVSDPCEPYRQSHHRPCQRCVVAQKPCGYKPCPLIPRYEDNCYVAKPVAPKCNVCDLRGCRSTYYNKCFDNPCERSKCHSYPQAKCYVDDCDCRKYYFAYEGKILHDNDCGYSYNSAVAPPVNYDVQPPVNYYPPPPPPNTYDVQPPNNYNVQPPANHPGGYVI